MALEVNLYLDEQYEDVHWFAENEHEDAIFIEK